MADYEAAAFESVEQLKEKHIQELGLLAQRVVEESKTRTNHSKEYLDLRRQEKVFFLVKEYEKSEAVRQRADRLEQRELETNHQQLTEELLI